MTKKQLLLLFAGLITVKTGVLVLVAAPKISAHVTGRTVTLDISPYDPYDFLSGYYMNISYDSISNPDPNQPMPYRRGQTVYARLYKGKSGNWHFDRVVSGMPGNIEEDELFIKGKMKRGRIIYGIERFYVPEIKRRQIGEMFRKYADQAKAVVKVDRFGNAAILKMKIKDNVIE
jgi:uncharacterized membrane-anchored protein